MKINKEKYFKKASELVNSENAEKFKRERALCIIAIYWEMYKNDKKKKKS